MKYVFSVFLFLLAPTSYGQFDVYQFCQEKMDMVKELSTQSPEELVKLKSSIAAADSFESIARVTGAEYESIISLLLAEGVSEEQAQTLFRSAFKPAAMNIVSLAILMQGVTDELEWNEAFDKCVYHNRDNF